MDNHIHATVFGPTGPAEPRGNGHRHITVAGPTDVSVYVSSTHYHKVMSIGFITSAPIGQNNSKNHAYPVNTQKL